ncbi:MAG: DUF692 domain-containing protein [Polyangiaceae bacterium]
MVLDQSYAEELLRTPRSVDWLEVTPQRWQARGGRQRWLLDACAERWPMVPHCTSLSIAGTDPLDDALLDEVNGFVRRLRAPWWSDHAAFCRADGRWLGELLPPPFSVEAVAHVAARVSEAEQRVGVPMLLENIAWSAAMPGSTMTEPDFLLALLHAAGCGILLDLATVSANAENHGYDARALIDQLPVDRLMQIHIGGRVRQGGRVWPTHAAPVTDEVWDLYAHTLARAGRLVATCVESGATQRGLDKALDDVDRARSLARWALLSRTEATLMAS